MRLFVRRFRFQVLQDEEIPMVINHITMSLNTFLKGSLELTF